MSATTRLIFAIKCPGPAGCRQNLRRDASQKEQSQARPIVFTRNVWRIRACSERTKKKKNRRRFPPSFPFRDHRKARSSRSSCVRTRIGGEKLYGPSLLLRLASSGEPTVVSSLLPFRMQVLELRMSKRKSRNSLRKNSSSFYPPPRSNRLYSRIDLSLFFLFVVEFMNSNHEMNYKTLS